MLLLVAVMDDVFRGASAQDCTSPENVKRKDAMTTRPEPDRGIQMQMVRRVERLSSSAENVDLETCPPTDAPRSRLVDEGDFRDRKMTMLWSIPGSGNTFARTIIEMAPGVYTGSVYGDRAIAKLMPGEQDELQTASACQKLSAIKSHQFGPLNDNCGFPIFTICDFRVSQAILLVRHPLSAAWAEF